MIQADQERSARELKWVSVFSTNEDDEYYEVDYSDVTAIQWGKTAGHMEEVLTVRVYKNRVLFSEHPFSSVFGVGYMRPEGEAEKAP